MWSMKLSAASTSTKIKIDPNGIQKWLEIEQRAPLKGDDNEIKAKLYYLFLDCGGIEELTAYDGFYNHLEKAFRHHVGLKKRVTDPANTQHNTFGTTSQARRPCDEEEGLDVQSRKYIDRITLTQKAMADD
jgi:hypothetical protein